MLSRKLYGTSHAYLRNTFISQSLHHRHVVKLFWNLWQHKGGRSQLLLLLELLEVPDDGPRVRRVLSGLVVVQPTGDVLQRVS